MVVCPNCGGENPDNAKFCLHCASPLGQVEQRGYRDLSTRGRSPATKAFAVAVEGLLEEDADRAAELLRRASGEFERLEMRIAQARVLIDVGEALVRAGGDPRPPLEEARDLLVACDARIYLPEVEALLASIAAER